MFDANNPNQHKQPIYSLFAPVVHSYSRAKDIGKNIKYVFDNLNNQLRLCIMNLGKSTNINDGAKYDQDLDHFMQQIDAV